jgi:hypothetical protein
MRVRTRASEGPHSHLSLSMELMKVYIFIFFSFKYLKFSRKHIVDFVIFVWIFSRSFGVNVSYNVTTSSPIWDVSFEWGEALAFQGWSPRLNLLSLRWCMSPQSHLPPGRSVEPKVWYTRDACIRALLEQTWFTPMVGILLQPRVATGRIRAERYPGLSCWGLCPCCLTMPATYWKVMGPLLYRLKGSHATTRPGTTSGTAHQATSCRGTGYS